MNKIHQHLKLQQHHHTGKLLPHHHTSYRSLAVVFIAALAVIGGLNTLSRAAAESLASVSATVTVPIPREAPVITLPADGSTSRTSQTTVAGNCPMVSPQVAIGIAVDGAQAGSGICTRNNIFSIAVTLTPGKHSITATPYTITGGTGKMSEPVQVNLNVNVTNVSSSTASILSDNQLSFLDASKTVSWEGVINGATNGQVAVAWGDGNRTNYTVQAGHQSLSHHYGKLASYNVFVTAVDSQGHVSQRQFAVAAYRTAAVPAAQAIAGDNTPFTGSTTYGLYALLITTLAMCGLLWQLARHTLHEEMVLHHG